MTHKTLLLWVCVIHLLIALVKHLNGYFNEMVYYALAAIFFVVMLVGIELRDAINDLRQSRKDGE